MLKADPFVLGNCATVASQIDLRMKTRKLPSTQGCTATRKSLLPWLARKDCQKAS
jgi:hypothetical protein